MLFELERSKLNTLYFSIGYSNEEIMIPLTKIKRTSTKTTPDIDSSSSSSKLMSRGTLLRDKSTLFRSCIDVPAHATSREFDSLPFDFRMLESIASTYSKQENSGNLFLE